MHIDLLLFVFSVFLDLIIETEFMNNSDSEDEKRIGKAEAMEREEKGATQSKLCLKCKQKAIAYECMPCRCPTYCSSCAMKVRRKYKY